MSFLIVRKDEFFSANYISENPNVKHPLIVFVLLSSWLLDCVLKHNDSEGRFIVSFLFTPKKASSLYSVVFRSFRPR
jgi:hypothetical protein